MTNLVVLVKVIDTDYINYRFSLFFHFLLFQELIDFFGPTVVFHSHDQPKLMQDEDFPELLMEKVAKAHRKVDRCPCTRVSKL